MEWMEDGNSSFQEPGAREWQKVDEEGRWVWAKAEAPRVR